MEKRSTISVLTATALLFSSGCGLLPGGDNADNPPESEQLPGQNPAEVPLKPAKVLPPVDVAALGLIPPVQPNQRRREIETGRPNPFALIPIKATVRESVCRVEEEEEEAKANKPPAPTAPTANNNTATQSPAQRPATSAPAQPGGIPGSGSVPGVTIPQPPPAPLYPNDARAVSVSGVVEINNRPFAIVKAPGEPVSRNVTVGDRLAGGKVRVKAINANSRTPQVILEQYGQTVSRAVGEPPLPPLQPPPPPHQQTGRSGFPGEVGEDGMITITGPDGTVVRVPAEFAEQEARRQQEIARRRAQTAAAQRRTEVALNAGDNAGPGFGEIRNLAVLKLNVVRRGDRLVGSTGILCNAGEDLLKVQALTLQVEDPEENTILDSIRIAFSRPYFLKKGQKLEFDGSTPDFRGRNPNDVIIQLIDWQSQLGS